jgi:hypothetical protein
MLCLPLPESVRQNVAANCHIRVLSKTSALSANEIDNIKTQLLQDVNIQDYVNNTREENDIFRFAVYAHTTFPQHSLTSIDLSQWSHDTFDEQYFEVPDAGPLGHLINYNLWLRFRNNCWLLRWVLEWDQVLVLFDVDSEEVICQILQEFNPGVSASDPFDYCAVHCIADYAVTRFFKQGSKEMIEMTELQPMEYYLTTCHVLVDTSSSVSSSSLQQLPDVAPALSKVMAFLKLHRPELVSTVEKSAPLILVPRRYIPFDDRTLGIFDDEVEQARKQLADEVEAEAEAEGLDKRALQRFVESLPDPARPLVNGNILDLKNRLFTCIDKQAFIMSGTVDDYLSDTLPEALQNTRCDLQDLEVVDLSNNQLHDCDLPHLAQFLNGCRNGIVVNLCDNWFALDSQDSLDHMLLILAKCSLATVDSKLNHVLSDKKVNTEKIIVLN